MLITTGSSVRRFEMWWGESVLATLSNPNLAFLLLVLGFYAILFELYTPGGGIAGTVGVICVLTALVGLAVLPLNYTGLALIAVALALFVAEVFVTSYGALTLGGVACLMLGGLMLVDSPAGFQRISLRVVLPVAVATAAISFLVGSTVRAHRRRVRTGAEGLAGTRAVADEAFLRDGNIYVGLVRAHGELWKARSARPVQAGAELTIQGREGLVLAPRMKTEADTSEAPQALPDQSVRSEHHAAPV